jgi:hypothetical protein
MQTFSRFEDFVAMHPLKGLGTDMATLRRLCRDDKEALDLLDRAVLRPGPFPQTLILR